MYSYIVTLYDSAVSDKLRNEPEYNNRQKLMATEAQVIMQELDLKGKIERVYGGAFFGFVINTTDEEIERLSKDPRVKYIEKDQGISLSPPEA
ncbi:MAG: protease inhibitor I9 family protein [Candidatus Cyclobacteriaceae bacterium M2_1C_046]